MVAEKPGKAEEYIKGRLGHHGTAHLLRHIEAEVRCEVAVAEADTRGQVRSRQR